MAKQKKITQAASVEEQLELALKQSVAKSYKEKNVEQEAPSSMVQDAPAAPLQPPPAAAAAPAGHAGHAKKKWMFWAQEPETASRPAGSVTQGEMTPNDFYYKAIPFDRNTAKSWLQRRREKKLKRKFPDSVVLVRMETFSGSFREILMPEQGGSVHFRQGEYILDSSLKYYIEDAKLWAYDFHEGISLPLKKKVQLSETAAAIVKEIEEQSRKGLSPRVNANEIKDLVESSNVVDVETSLNPSVLQRFTDSKVIEQILQGAVLGRIFKIMLYIVIAVGVLQIAIFLMQLYQSGALDQLKSMFNH